MQPGVFKQGKYSTWYKLAALSSYHYIIRFLLKSTNVKYKHQ